MSIDDLGDLDCGSYGFPRSFCACALRAQSKIRRAPGLGPELRILGG